MIVKLDIDKTGVTDKAMAGENSEIFGLFEENPAAVSETKAFIKGLLEDYTRGEMNKKAIVKNIIDLLATIKVSDPEFVLDIYLKLAELEVDKEAIFEQRYSLTNVE